MINLSINTSCNNNCEYCFQKDSYHQLNEKLSIDEIDYLLENWCVGVGRIGIMGGEPTLHKDCLEILKKTAQKYNTIFFTNLLCSTNILKELLQIQNVNWLINTTTRDELKHIFIKNIEYINSLEKKHNISLGITLTGNLKKDEKFITNLINLGKNYPHVSEIYRISLASPCHDVEYKLINYDASVLRLYELMDKYTPNFKISFDCTINCCQLSKDVFSKVLTDSRTWRISSSCNEASIGIMADKKVDYCFSVPEEIFNGKKYTDFKNWQECHQYILKIKKEFLSKYYKFCKTCNKCKNEDCEGACFASCVHLVRQQSKKPLISQKFTKMKYAFLNRHK